MFDKIGAVSGHLAKHDFVPSDRGRLTDGASPAGVHATGSIDPVGRSVDHEVVRLTNYLETRGLEVRFRASPHGGMPQLIIMDPISGRTVLEVPRGTSLEQSLGVIVQRTGLF